jgi:peptidoglycan/xylan/chitin deacetylase (PgdA/CDA1 family)
VLLDLFTQYDAQMTFFNIGKSVKKWPDLVRECASQGRYIADHTWDHGSLEGMTHEGVSDWHS